jgi:protease-4
VHAWGKNFDQAQYHLAAHADEVFLNPDGYVLLTGFGRFPPTSRACSTRPA